MNAKKMLRTGQVRLAADMEKPYRESGWRVGGEVTQRIANPSLRPNDSNALRFATPPDISKTHRERLDGAERGM